MPARIDNAQQGRVLMSVLFFLPFTLLVVLTVLLFVLSSALRTSHVWVTHTLEVKNTIGHLFNHLLEAESATRGFLLTGSAAFVEDEEVAARAKADLQRLERLTKDNPLQQQSVAAINVLVSERMDFLGRVLRFQKQNQGARPREMIERGQQKMDAIRPILVAMEKEEDRLLELREARAETHGRFIRMLATALLLVDLCGLGVIALLSRRAKRLEQLVTVCAWTKTIQHEGRWVSFEEYLKQRFGISVTHSMSRAAYDKLRTEVDTQTAQAA